MKRAIAIKSFEKKAEMGNNEIAALKVSYLSCKWPVDGLGERHSAFEHDRELL
jgi:hypothetical protein